MRKTILMLINGLGVERKGSAEVYSSKLMPNFDYMVKNSLFGNLLINAGDYNNAYKAFSIPDKKRGKEDEIDDLIFEKKLEENEVLRAVRDNINVEGKLHVFWAVENAEKLNQVREYLKVINVNKDKKVFIHLIMTASAISAYDDIIKVISKLSFELSDYGKIGMIVGQHKINSDDVLRAFYREVGEHWNESTKKFEILKKEVINPEDASVFIIHGGFALKENDSIFFVNYEELDIEKFYSEFTKVPVKQYSLYPFKEQIPFMFQRADESQTVSFASTVEKFGIKILHLTSESRINDINFYLNGMQKKKSPNITYAVNDINLFATKERVIDLIDSNDYNGFIIDYTIAEYNRMEDIKRDLQNIDAVIKNISDAALEKDYTFIISSLYGMHAPVMDGVVQKVVDLSGKVPCIFQSNLFTKSEYSLNTGNTYSLQQTFLTNICDDVKGNKLVHKLSNIERMLTKGK